MKPVMKFVTVLLAAGILGGAYAAQAAGDKAENDAAGVKTAAVSMTDAVNVALGAVPGTPSKAEFETDDAKGNALWSVEIVSDKGVMDIEVDASTGQIIKQTADDNDQDEHENEAGERGDKAD